MNDSGDSCRPKRSPRRTGLWLLLGLALAVAALLLAWRLLPGDPIPPLSPEQFHAARARWKAIAPQDYNIEIVVRGSQPATYAVQVRDGKAEQALRNGRPLRQRRTFGTWSVPGMFSTIARDVEAVERFNRGKAEPGSPQLRLRAEFDPKYSYPARYRRIQWGSPVEVSWEVTRFEVKKSQ